MGSPRWLKPACALLGAVLIAEIALAIWLPLRSSDEKLEASQRVFQSVYSGTFDKAAVAADSSICSSLGSNVLLTGFNLQKRKLKLIS